VGDEYFFGHWGGSPDCCKILIVMFLYRMIVFKTSGKLIECNQNSVTKIAGVYNLLIIFLNQDYTEEDE
jgi:hypothetical protein